ncbi:unnamed protein product [Arabis nemorensis]|uniref:Uncharacterized protein n=1 Tax=Arabis nemorensis TaxID=586526 RepID=A0A565BER1_9BRAS|nr:unnamed protein product [Arabis nemorensis]
MLPDAKTGLKNGDYDKAGESLKFALMFPMRCKFNLQRAKFDKYEYPQVYSQINIYAQLSDAAMRIIDRF